MVAFTMTTSSIQQKIAWYGKKQGKTQSVQTENINDKMVELYPHIHTHAHTQRHKGKYEYK